MPWRKVQVTCPMCNGTGCDPISQNPTDTCPTCQGRGHWYEDECVDEEDEEQNQIKERKKL